jgi:hypothetical protein
MATEKKILKEDLSVNDPFKLIQDSAKKTLIDVNLLKNDLQTILPLTEKIFKGKSNTVADIKAQENALKMLNDQADRARKIQEQSVKDKIALERLEQAQIRTNNLKNAQVQKEIQQTEKLTRAQQRAQSEYFKIQDRLTKVSNAYRNLAIRKELSNNLSDAEEIKLLALQKRLIAYDGVLKKVDAQMGRHQRNVGNYSSAYNGLSFSVAQLTRETPAFANSMQTGFMAISNNLPIFFDEIQKIKTANAELRASGQATTSVFKQIASSIFSFQTLLSVGVTLLTIFGAKMVDYLGKLFDAKDATAEIRLENERLAKIQKEQIEYVSKESKEMGVLLLRLKATNQGTKERSNLITEINNQYGTTLTNMSDEAMFQAQINSELKKYLQYKEAEFKIKQNEDYIQSLFNKKQKTEIELKKNKSLLDKENAKYGAFGGPETAFERVFLEKLNDEYTKSEAHLNRINSELERSGMVIQKLSVTMDEFGYKRIERTDKEAKSQKELNKNFDDYIKLREKEIEILSPQSESPTTNQSLVNEQIKLTTQEINLAIEARRGNIKGVLDAEKEILKIRAEILRIEYDEKILNTSDEREKTLLILERDLEIEKVKTAEKEAQNKYDEANLSILEDSLSTEKEKVDIAKELASISKEVFEITKDYLTNVLQAQIKSIDEQIQMVNKSYSALEEKANNGNIKAGESIKEQMRLEQELIAIREKKARQVAFIGALSGTVNSFAGGSGGQSLGQLLSGLQGFETGTEYEVKNYVNPNLTGVGKDNIAVRVHGKERIINEDLARKIQGHKTSDVVNGYVQYHQMLAQNAINSNKGIDLSETNNLLKKQLENKPTEYNIGKVLDTSFELIRRSQKGNSIETQIRRIRR